MIVFAEDPAPLLVYTDQGWLTPVELVAACGFHKAYILASQAWSKGDVPSTFVDAVASLNTSTVHVVGRRMECPWCGRHSVRLQAKKGHARFVLWRRVRALCACCALKLQATRRPRGTTRRV